MGLSLKFSAYGLIFGSRYLSLSFRFSSSQSVSDSFERERRYHVELIPPIGLLGRRRPMDRLVVSI